MYCNWRVEQALLVNLRGDFISICNRQHCTYCNVIRASNFACTLSRSPTILCIQLVYIVVDFMLFVDSFCEACTSGRDYPD